MSFWSERFYFERHGDRYVYRPTVFSAGFDVSEREKEELFEGLVRLNWRSLIEAAFAFAFVAGAFISGAIKARDEMPWLLMASIMILALSAAAFLYRRDQLAARVLGGRSPEVPQLPITKALARPRPIIARRYAIPVLQSTTVLLSLSALAVDALVAYLAFAAYRAGAAAQGPEEVAAVEKFVSLTLTNPQFWLFVAMFNAVSLAGAVFSTRVVRRMRTVPGDT